MNRGRRLRGYVTWNTSRERELLAQLFQALFGLRNVGVELAVGALQVRVGYQPGSSMTRTGYVDDAQIVLLDQPIDVNVDEIQPRCGAPMTQQARLDVRDLERLVEQWIGEEVDLSHGDVVRRTPVGMHLAQLFGGQRLAGCTALCRTCGCLGIHRATLPRLDRISKG